MCQGKSECKVTPTREMFTPAVTCKGRAIMWITWSCDGGDDITSGVGYKPFEYKPLPAINMNLEQVTTPLPNIQIGVEVWTKPGNCPNKPGTMVSKDIPVTVGKNKGWIRMACDAIAPYTKSCLTIHKVRTACSGHGGPIQAHVNLVIKQLHYILQ